MRRIVRTWIEETAYQLLGAKGFYFGFLRGLVNRI
ncbi:hypothetical protein AHiyo4_11390 [Arthrobacter sp. Hiyo4]|nr:hypothetical protein AHiyo4_11390 [Arthrobacter sp. Hiyo4]